MRKFAALLPAAFFALTFVTTTVQADSWFVREPNDQEVLIRNGAALVGHTINPAQLLRMTVWNVHKFADNECLVDVKNLAAQSDLVLLEESMIDGRFNGYFNSYKDFEWAGAISFFKDQGVGTGVSTGSRYTPSYENYIRSSAREPVLNTPKMIVISRYPIQGRSEELLVANIHGINFVDTAAYASQIAQLEAAIRGHKGPMVVAGDFNTWLYTRGLILHDMATRLGLNYVNLSNRNYAELNLDHIFVRGISPVSAYEIHGVKSSDHRPLYFEGRFD